MRHRHSASGKPRSVPAARYLRGASQPAAQTAAVPAAEPRRAAAADPLRRRLRRLQRWVASQG